MQPIGFGQATGTIAVYVEKRPPIASFNTMTSILPLQTGEIDWINAQAGNGWRKLFNVYAKLVQTLALPQYQAYRDLSWQQWRDQYLLQRSGQEALLFSAPDLAANQYLYHIIAGRTYGKQLLAGPLAGVEMVWLDEEFAICAEHRLIICPYFDYRQLSNVKISFLSDLVKTLAPGEHTHITSQYSQ
ncbi:DUF6942 family protein [Pseudoalteromonas fenneropenaei]|uniref:DUF6942 family protein n=1 Tax=Pseudoalteromonas fenneropenaei TaxID=1737459 RepID=A0ABV7CJ92_9GAMM